MPPFTLNKFSYPELQPQNLLLARHKKVLLSAATNPNGRKKLSIKIGPPKQMSTKWFFQKEFSQYHLLKISASAASFQYPRFPSNTQGNILTLYSLDTNFFHNSNWALTQTDKPYVNIDKAPATYYFRYYDEKGSTIKSGEYT